MVTQPMPRNQELHFGVIFAIFRNVKELIEEKTERNKVNYLLETIQHN
jgi:hypothetical protein